MTRFVHCHKYDKRLPGLSQPPFPGPQGEHIYNNISQQAWGEWQNHQTMLINERKLDTRDPHTRQFLQQEMKKFFAGKDHAHAAGFVPQK